MMTSPVGLRFGATGKVIKTNDDGTMAVIEIRGGRVGAKKLQLEPGTRVTLDRNALYLDHEPAPRRDGRILEALMELTNWKNLPERVRFAFVRHFADTEPDTKTPEKKTKRVQGALDTNA